MLNIGPTMHFTTNKFKKDFTLQRKGIYANVCVLISKLYVLIVSNRITEFYVIKLCLFCLRGRRMNMRAYKC
jgi:hypothetical protein